MPRYLYRTFGCPGRKLKSGVVPEHAVEMMVEPDEHPAFCPKCGRDWRKLKLETIPGTHSIGGSDIAKGVDLTWKLIQESSAERAELAGNKALRVTDMKDHLREGDVAVPMPSVSPQMASYMNDSAGRGIQYGWGGGMMAPAFSSGAGQVARDPKTGFTGPTEAVLSTAQGLNGTTHLGKAKEMIYAGAQNKDKDGRILDDGNRFSQWPHRRGDNS